MNILPEDNNLPESVLGTPVDILFSTSDGSKIISIENMDNSTLTVDSNRIHGKYIIDPSTTILTRENLEYKTYSRMSEVPKGTELYYYKPVMTRNFTYRYKVSTDKESKIYSQKVNTDWTLLSEGVRNYVRSSI